MSHLPLQHVDDFLPGGPGGSSLSRRLVSRVVAPGPSKEIVTLEREIEQQENLISILIGSNPRSVARDETALAPLSAEVPRTAFVEIYRALGWGMAVRRVRIDYARSLVLCSWSLVRPVSAVAA